MDRCYMGWEVLGPEPPQCSQSRSPAIIDACFVTSQLFALQGEVVPVLVRISFITSNRNLVFMIGIVKNNSERKKRKELKKKKNPHPTLHSPKKRKRKTLTFKFTFLVLPYGDLGHKAKGPGVVSQKLSSLCTVHVTPHPTQSHPYM